MANLFYGDATAPEDISCLKHGAVFFRRWCLKHGAVFFSAVVEANLFYSTRQKKKKQIEDAESYREFTVCEIIKIVTTLVRKKYNRICSVCIS